MQGFVFTPSATVGDTARHHGPLVVARQGLHAGRHPYAALRLSRGDTLAVARLGGRIAERAGFLCASERTVLRTLDAGPLLADFARQCAQEVAHLWNAPVKEVAAWESGMLACMPPVPSETSARFHALCAGRWANLATMAAWRASHGMPLPGDTVSGHAFAALQAAVAADANACPSLATYLNAQVELALSL